MGPRRRERMLEPFSPSRKEPGVRDAGRASLSRTGYSEHCSPSRRGAMPRRRTQASGPPRSSTFRPHPWHGLDVGPAPPDLLTAFIEVTPFDLVKYEVDKQSGYLRIDRAHRGSSQPPTLYGFVPRTYCGPRTHRLSPKSVRGDGDPLDICVLSERPIQRGEILVRARA